ETEYPVVLLESEELGDVLPIWIGRAEAAAIYNVLSKKTFKRPMTHDLIRVITDTLGVVIAGVEITGIYKETYFARIILERGKEVYYIDARPSDSIALALRAEASIMIDSELFEKYKRNLRVGQEDDVIKRMKELDPGDFGDMDL
ncbi:MAG: bifunctional nuclease family protein, partial [Candidatus Krumholzibacteria bacterium]|nr:bifunctional nuclease family protein [Candidatus Krumholzibacteria bacterium]